ncbi:transposase family protein [Actinoplanes sp. NPDC049681]|uniref:transposase family protein n=1 Tax=Actinoplanes sp. NPDC049681 TaxID=3363905 RepID=UPI00379783BD
MISQAGMRDACSHPPDGIPIWTFAAMPGHFHDLACARELGVTAALNWAAAELHLPALPDASYDGAGHGIKTPTRQPADGKHLAVANRSVNRRHRSLRWQGERGFAILTGRWKTLRHSTVSPRWIGDIVAGRQLGQSTGMAFTRGQGVDHRPAGQSEEVGGPLWNT